MTTLKTTQEQVKEVLLAVPETRDDDMMLYFYVCENCTPAVGNLRFAIVMTQYRTFGIPCFESVRRTRQKLQAQHSELSCTARTRQLRATQEKNYRQYAKE